ncbi:MAG: DUF1189 domain-containing protein [Nitrospirae bacterium]|nr:DUF1189 domain-containing protein [Nitrospirota bacterium]MCL5422974.1 DUF1189 domain-containing protein [Nitrospirota bacterium]
MRQFTTVHPLFMSFYSKALYQDVGRNWKKISLLYLLLLLSVCSIPIVFRVHSALSDYLHQEAPKIVKQVPVITIDKGVASVNEEMPYIIKDPESSAPLIIIDTTGKTDSLKGSDAIVLLTKTKLFFRRSARDTRTLDLSEIDTLTIDQARVYDWIETFLDYFIFVFYPFALLFSFLFRLVEALIFGAIGMLFARNMKVPLRYQATLSLALVSMTPAIILDTLYNYGDINIPFWWIINFLIAVGYLFFAVKANAEHAGLEAGA